MATFIWPPGAGASPTPGDLCECYFATLAEMAAYSAPNARPLMYNFETDRPYEFVPGDTTPVDGWTVIASAAGFAGRWILRAEDIALSPLGNGVDDAPHVIGALNNAPCTVRMNPGRYAWLSSVQITRSHSRLEASGPDVIIDSDGMPVGPIFQATNCIFQANPYSAAPVTTTLAGPFNQGDDVMTVTDDTAIAVDDYIAVRDQALNRITDFRVIGKLPNSVIELDRANGRPVFLPDATIVKYTPLTDVEIIGNGARIVSSNPAACGDRVLNFVGAWRCAFRGWNISGVWNEFQCSFDGAGYENIYEDIYVDCNGTGYGGLAMETGQAGIFRRCTVVNAGPSATGAFAMPNGLDHTLQNCVGNRNTNYGLVLATNADPSEVYGCRGCRVVDCEFSANGVGGIVVDDGSAFNSFERCNVFGNPSGLVFSPGTNTPVFSNLIIGGRYYSNGVGVDVQGSVKNRAIGIETEGNSVAGIRCALGGELELIDPMLNEGLANTNAIDLTIGPGRNSVSLVGGRIDMTLATAFSTMIATGTDGRIRLAGTDCEFAAATLGVIVQSTADSDVSIELDRVKQTSGNGSVLTAAGTNQKIRLGIDCDVQPVYAGSLAQLNYGFVNMNGLTAVAVAYPGLVNLKVPQLQRYSGATAGVGSVVHYVSLTPGTGFSIVATLATDDSLYYWKDL